MDGLYFSERELGVRPRTDENISAAVWGGVMAVVEACLNDESFGSSFPYACPDGAGVAGANGHQFSLALCAEVPGIKWPLKASEVPDRLAILDFMEFCHRHVAKPIQGSFHPFFQHHHLTFDREAGQSEFRQRINRIFSRNGIAYELKADGSVIRLAPEILAAILQPASFQTGDSDLDAILESARAKFLSPNGQIRREALEKLWDAWERIKTLEAASDKKGSIKILLDKAAKESKFRDLLEREAKELTNAGNSFQIRHSEISQTPLQSNEHVDYLFHRLFALIHMLLIMRGGQK